MSESIIYIDRSEIRTGRRDELEAAMNELVRLIEASEPALIAYNAYIASDGSTMTVVHVHPDSASLELHMKVVGPVLPKFAPFVELSAIDVYGRPSDAVLEQLRRKARTLGSGTVHVQVHERAAGFARFGASLAESQNRRS